ncbi:hypothetical protein GXP70_12445 [Paenibacillus lycopersici]|uniref:Uncharacterized protein n=1 Tax=Paenibacillus lycopersici TaxID=2704462 RepID=A0A6C0G291_9BACL|nr:hypothetical protein [Paenibacillus lycopersici]QHT60670.1 hypothetical protein GXP70_12445 [Paenibacillus lycopersici]
MTLDEMIQQCAVDIDEELPKSGGVYVGDELVTANKIVAGLNYAYQKAARDKHFLTMQETMTLDDKRSFTVSSLAQPVVKVWNVYDASGEPIDWIERNQATIVCSDYDSGAAVTVEYSYLPPRLLIANLNGSPLITERQIDHMIFCYYADFYVLSLEPDNESREKASTFLGLFNDGIDSAPMAMSSEYTIFRVER